MRNFIFALVIFIATFVTTVSAQDQKVLTVDVTFRPKAELWARSATIRFSQSLNVGLEFYQVMDRGRSEVKGTSQLIDDLYYEPGLLAKSVYVYDDRIEVVFLQGMPNSVRLSNILNRIIKIVQRNQFPNSRLEINNYDPLLGASTTRLANYKVPPPAIRRP